MKYSEELLSWEELSTNLLYAILQLRMDVFVVEQDCPYLDTDDKDQLSHHLVFTSSSEQVIAYSRIVPPGVSYPKYCSIGRVVSARSVRRQGMGITLMQASIQACEKLFPNTSIKISAQCYLQKFYERFGFTIVGDEYLEDDIPHIAMVLISGH